MSLQVLRWPYPRAFAFGITDDTDLSTLDSVRTFYEFCLARGIRPTKTVWVRPPRRASGSRVAVEPVPGITLADPEYRRYCQELSRRGVELCLHDVSAGNNLREEILDGFREFEEVFGYLPRLHVCHGKNAEHPYWGPSQYDSRLAKTLVRWLVDQQEYSGEVPSSPHYWSDFCRATIRYLRLYRTMDFDVLAKVPAMPYHLPGKPDVRLWFSTSAARRLDRLTDATLDRLARRDGAFLWYAYSANLVTHDRREVLPAVAEALERLAARDDCWLATSGEILDRCLAIKNLVVTRRRHGWVIANASDQPLPSLQLRCPAPVLHLASGSELSPDAEGRFVLDHLAPGAAVALYESRGAAGSGDLGGISRLGLLRMMVEELRFLAWKRWKTVRGARRRTTVPASASGREHGAIHRHGRAPPDTTHAGSGCVMICGDAVRRAPRVA
ncbi:MAG: hypothetical protein AAF533_23035 [Acidobacteriota bacterium]